MSADAQARLEQLIDEGRPRLAGNAPTSPARTKPATPAAGTTILREWHGETHRVNVVESGYELNGIVFPSASALARHVTGQRWNGRLWLGLTERKKQH